MLTSSFPFKYLAILSDSTLTTNIRERSWDLDKIFPQIKAAKSEIKELGKGIKSDSGSIFKLRQSIAALAAEIKAGFRDLKLINFYDSAIFYLYFRLLSHVLELCKKEESRLRSIKKAKIQIEEKIKEYEKLIKNFGAAKKSLIEDYEQMVKALEKRRWGLEKQAQHELGLLRITLRSMSNLNRKIKIEAIKVKKYIVPQKKYLIGHIQKGQVNPKDIVMLAKLVSKAIDDVSKDVYYSSKLLSKFQDEVSELKAIVENLKKAMDKYIKNGKIKEENAKTIIKPWDDIVKHLEEEVDKDLMQIFRNIFVEYKYIGTRQLKAA